MDQNNDKFEFDLNKIFQNLGRYDEDGEPYFVTVRGSSLNFGNEDKWYKLCSCCRKIFEQTWDHEEWCKVYEPEPLSDWIQKGKKE